MAEGARAAVVPHGLQRELRGDTRVEDLREMGRRRECGRPSAPRRLSRLLPKDLDARVPADATDVLLLRRDGHEDAAGESVALRGIEWGVGAGGRLVGEGRGGRGVLSAPGAVGTGRCRRWGGSLALVEGGAGRARRWFQQVSVSCTALKRWATTCHAAS